MNPDNDTASSEKPSRKPDVPAAGPHARPGLIDKDKTPGTGMLPEPDERGSQAPSG
jgi:hypothetical protein